jgi:hypothetical protein
MLAHKRQLPEPLDGLRMAELDLLAETLVS